MNVKDLISVSIKDGTVFFSLKDDSSAFHVIGCSCTLSKKNSATFDKSLIVVRPQRNAKVTVIGLAIGYMVGGSSAIVNVFIGIYRNDDVLQVDLDRHYTFTGGAISSGDKFFAVITLDDGRKFGHYTEYLQKGKTIPEGFQLVENTDLLFQFASGVIDLKTLETYATGDNRSAQSIEIAGLKQRISLLETELGEKTLTITDLRGELKRENDVSQGLYTIVSNQTNSIERLEKTIEAAYQKHREDGWKITSLMRQVLEFKTVIQEVKECVFGSWLSRVFPWGIVSACRGIVGCYKDEELK